MKKYIADSFKTTAGEDLVLTKLDTGTFAGTAEDLNTDIQDRVVIEVGKSLVADAEITKLSHLDDTTDLQKPVSTAQQTALDNLETSLQSDIQAQITGSTLINGVTESSSVPPTGNIHAIGIGTGTYPNWGGMVIPANNIGTLQRVGGVYSVSLTPISGLFNIDNSVSWDGTISFNQTTKAVAITAGTVFTKDGYKGATTSESVTVPSGDYIIVYLDNALTLHFAPFYTYDKSPTNIILARLDTNGTNVIKVNYCLNRDYVIDDKLYKGNVHLQGITTPINFKESAENSYKIVTTGGIKQMQISAGIYFLSDKLIGSNGYVTNTAQNLDFTLDYNYLFYNYNTGVFKFTFYSAAVQADFDNTICLGMFYVTDSKVWAITASGIGYFYNGIPLKSSEVYVPNGIKYAQIGDSITIKDNKYETDIDYVGGLTGYQDYGYGRRICEELKIPYANHYPQGKNGYSSGDYVYRLENGLITFPSDISLFSLFIGTNDWGTENIALGTPVDYINNTYNEASNRTSYGAFRKIIDHIIGAKSTSDLTHPKIILMTPMLRGSFGYKNGDGSLAHYMKSAIEKNVSTGLWQYTTNSHGFTLKDIADLVKWVAAYEGLPCIDLFEDGFIEKRFLNIETTWTNFATEDRPLVYNDILLDNLHPTTKGYDLLYSRIVDEFKRVVKK